MGYPVKLYHSNMTNAPAIAGAVGSLVSFLDACLINGFNTSLVNSITHVGAVATATVQLGHGFVTGDIVQITGANQPAYNGEFRVTVQSASVFTYTMDVAPGIDASGALQCRYAPQGGWLKADSADGQGLYKSASPEATGRQLKVLDTGLGWPADQTATQKAYCVGLLNDTTLAGYDPEQAVPFPGLGQAASGMIVRKSDSTDGGSRPWVLIAEDRLFYLFIGWNSAANSAGLAQAYLEPFVFGDIESYFPGDAYRCAIIGNTFVPTSPGVASPFLNMNGGSQSGQFLCGDANQLPGPIPFTKLGVSPNFSGSSSQPRYQPPNDLVRLRGPVELADNAGGSANPLRGYLPGLYEVLNAAAGSVQTLDTSTVPGLPGRELVFVRAMSGVTPGLVAFDLIGPWR